jgi:hypothetical protein
LLRAPQCNAQKKTEKCDEQVKIRDEQASGVEMEFVAGLGECLRWAGKGDGEKTKKQARGVGHPAA